MPLPANARPISAAELRKCAESADGRRKAPLDLVYAVQNGKAENEGRYIMLSQEDRVSAYATGWTLHDVIKTKTDLLCANHGDEDKTTATITPFGGDTVSFGAGEADSLFWTESAVEKFVLPYYIRHLSKSAFEVLYEGYHGLNEQGRAAGALSHQPSTEWTAVRTARQAGMTEAQIEQLQPLFALGIVPTAGGDPQLVQDPARRSLPLYLMGTPAGKKLIDRI